MIQINVESIVFLIFFYLVFSVLIVCVHNLIEKNVLLLTTFDAYGSSEMRYSLSILPRDST